MKTPRRGKLANLPTPLERTSYNGTPFLIKRDDLTGFELSGNKVRKLEYLLCGISAKNTDVIFTCGGEQSNHARAVTVAAARLGVPVCLFLWGRQRTLPEGNLFVSTFLNAKIVWLNKNEYWRVNEIMLAAKAELTKAGKRVLIIPEGGTSPLGIWGYINAAGEMRHQLKSSFPNQLWVAAGSGGTAAGLLLGSALHGLNCTVYAVNVLYDAETIRQKILETAARAVKAFGIPVSGARLRLEVVDGYSAEGYKAIALPKVERIRQFASQTGILLDPAYTGKAFCAFSDHGLMQYGNSKSLFIHTGGFLGILPHRREYLA